MYVSHLDPPRHVVLAEVTKRKSNKGTSCCLDFKRYCGSEEEFHKLHQGAHYSLVTIY